MAFRRLLWPLGVLLLSGCCSVLPDPGEPAARALAYRILDPEPTRTDPTLRPATAAEKASSAPLRLPDRVGQKDKTPPADLLVIPPGLPGSGAPPLVWPKTPAEREQVLKKLYPPLPPLPPLPRPVPGPNNRPLGLSDLQSLAAGHNPSIQSAVNGVQAARGAVVQAAAFPNPSIFWESDTVGTGGTGYQGAGFDQPIKGANKLRLARAAAEMDLRNAELALKKAQSDLATHVRTHYFALLVAAENVKVSRALADFTANVYRVQLDLLKAEQAAPYEPIQLRPLYEQARFNLIQAINQYHASWKQLAAALGLPDMPPTELAGRVDMPVPVFDYDRVRQYLIAQHTDVLSALNTIQKGRYQLELAQVQPIPDFDLHVLIQKDYTTPQRTLVYSGALTMPIPLWDRNRGNIQQAQGQLHQAARQAEQSKLQLTESLADADNRYRTAHAQVRIFSGAIESQVMAYRGVYGRYRELGDVTFGDVVTAQQTLAGFIATYITALGAQWTAVVDMANLLQTDDLFGLGQTEQFAPVPDLGRLLPEACPPPARVQLQFAPATVENGPRPALTLAAPLPEITPAPRR